MLTKTTPFQHLLIAALLSLGFTRCGDAAPGGKWKPYAERQEEESRAARQKAGLRARESRVDGPEASPFPSSMDSFDRSGRLVLSRRYAPTGAVTSELAHTYADNRLMKTLMIDERGPMTITFAYDAQGQKTDEWITNGRGDTAIVRHYTYDAQGNEISATFSRKESGQNAQKETTYDPQGRPLVVKNIEKGKTTWEERYLYRGDTLMEVERIGEDGVPQQMFTMRFDAQGHCTLMEQRSAREGREMRVRKSYDAEGRPLKDETLNASGNVVETTQYSYDAKGMLERVEVQRASMPGTVRYVNRYY